MNSKPDWLHEKQITLSNGTSALWSYDTEADFLEIFFSSDPATATIELADGIYLRFDRQKEQPLSIGILGVTSLTQIDEFGLPLLALEDWGRWPESERSVILTMLQAPPLNTIVKLYSFQSPLQTKSLPAISLAQPVLLAA